MKNGGNRPGDGGLTGLGDGARVSKGAARIAALGTLDELGAALGMASAEMHDPATRELVASLQRDLLALGARLATGAEEGPAPLDRASFKRVRLERIERVMAELEEQLPDLRAFILLGGTRAGAALHWARTVCRRAERAVVGLAEKETVDPVALSYLNRLSDVLFALARTENHRAGVIDAEW
jgi:cob(I)alamin adenosyltransferase